MTMISIVKRLAVMPMPLMFFSLLPWAVMALFFFASLMPGFQAEVYGTLVSRREWWSSGGGTLVSIGFGIFTAQLFAIIYQVRFVDLIVGGAWVVLSFSQLLIGPSLTDNIVGGPSRESWMIVAAASAVLGLAAFLSARFVPAQSAYLLGK